MMIMQCLVSSQLICEKLEEEFLINKEHEFELFLSDFLIMLSFSSSKRLFLILEMTIHSPSL
jgi:hypothetical protein